MRINHIAIYANDIEKLFSFYNQKLGFREVQRIYHENGKIKMIRLEISENQNIEIFNFSTQKIHPKERLVNWGFMHMGFTIDNIKEIRRKMIDNKVAVMEDIFIGNDGLYHLFVEDSENNLIEFTEDVKANEEWGINDFE